MRRAGTGVVADRPVFSTFNLNSAHTDSMVAGNVMIVYIFFSCSHFLVFFFWPHLHSFFFFLFSFRNTNSCLKDTPASMVSWAHTCLAFDCVPAHQSLLACFLSFSAASSFRSFEAYSTCNGNNKVRFLGSIALIYVNHQSSNYRSWLLGDVVVVVLSKILETGKRPQYKI